MAKEGAGILSREEEGRISLSLTGDEVGRVPDFRIEEISSLLLSTRTRARIFEIKEAGDETDPPDLKDLGSSRETKGIPEGLVLEIKKGKTESKGEIKGVIKGVIKVVGVKDTAEIRDLRTTDRGITKRRRKIFVRGRRRDLLRWRTIRICSTWVPKD